MYKPILKPVVGSGYAYASSRRYPKEPITVMVTDSDSERYKYVGAWFDAKDGQRRYLAFRKQSGDGPMYLFRSMDFAARYA